MHTRTIWKYPLKPIEYQELEIPSGHPISVAIQKDFAGNETLCLWAEVLPDTDPFKYAIHIYGTGHPMDPQGSGDFLGTVQTDGLVFHVYSERL